ncbi:MAG: hypothetical protein JST00_32475 [Deltaproteobacteria bacterium]|nr:hypothetical protein [Deltaproteobacteria bacterium]
MRLSTTVRFATLVAFVLAASTPGCSTSGGSSGDAPAKVAPPAPAVDWPHLACDPLVPSKCGFPFPSNVYTVPAPDTETGRRVQLDDAMMPVAANGQRGSGAPWSKLDGFSASGSLLAHLPGATGAGLPPVSDPKRSLEAECPTVLLDTVSGQRVLHFAELDRSDGDEAHRTLVIHPLVPLVDGRRYVVAVRRVKGETEALAPSPAFKALRDLEATTEPSVDARRPLYEDIFARLGTAGVPRADLQLAWDFTTASKKNVTGWLLSMRDRALALAGDAGPAYRIERVDETWEPTQMAYRIDAVMTAPLFVDPPGPGAVLRFGADGMPEPDPAKPTYDVPVAIMIPKSALTAPAALLQYGHGLLGSRSQIEASNFRKLANDKNYVIFATDLVGMASDGDRIHISDVIASGRIERISTMFDRMHQGFVNALLAMRMMKNAFAKDPRFGKLVDPSKRYYHGISQGGIAGGVYMAASTDVERGVLEVMGQPYTLLLHRSVDFHLFFVVLRTAYPDTRDQQLVLALVQMLWDRVEPAGYTKYLRGGLPSTPPHEVLMRSALGDHQVTTWGAQVMARAVGAKLLDSGLGDRFGLEKVATAPSGSFYTEYDFGLPPEPVCNVPMNLCGDPHGLVRKLQPAEDQLDAFLRTGEGRNFCAGGACKFPEQSGCDGTPLPDLCAE